MAEVPPGVASLRDKWQHRGQGRPSFAVDPAPGQESVWDYPRPPAIRPDSRLVEVSTAAGAVARTDQAVRVLETASPPVFYLPPSSVDFDVLVPSNTTSLCEWKGRATHWALVQDDAVVPDAAWSYDDPFPEFDDIAGWVSFYPARVECYVGGERVRPQAGGFYGGWITDELVGPFKGEPGSGAW